MTTKQTSKSFGDKWQSDAGKNFAITKEEVEEQILSLFACNKEEDLNEIFKDDMNCLDAGCGVGWAEALYNINPKVNRFAIDISDSVEVAATRTKDIENVLVLKSDIGKLPFKYKFFDIIFSNGVLHHTGDTQKYFSILCDHLKPGGIIGVYIYNKKPLIRSLADKYIRKNTTKLSHQECVDLSTQITLLGKSLSKINEFLEVEEDIPLLGIKKGKYNLQRFIYNHFIKCFYDINYDISKSVITNLDWYHPVNVTFHTSEEILSWFYDNNIRYNVRLIQPNGWKHSGYFVSGRKVE